MRAGRLQTRRIKVRRMRLRIFFCCIIPLVVIIGAVYLNRAGIDPLTLVFSPKSTLTPEEEAQTDAQLTFEGTCYYALQMGVFSDAQAAQTQAQSVKKRGAAGYLWQDGKQYRVLGACYETRAQAQGVATRLKQEHDLDTYIVALPIDALSLKLSGQAHQVVAAKDCLSALFEHTGQLLALSLQLDQGTLEDAKARQALKALLQTLEALNEKLSRAFEVLPEHLAPVKSGLTQMAHTISEAQSASGVVALGATIKYAMLEALFIAKDYGAQLYKAP